MVYSTIFNSFFIHGIALGLGVWLTVYAINRGFLYLKALFS